MLGTADVAVCIPFWARDAAGLSDVRASVDAYRALYPAAEIVLCDDGSTVPVPLLFGCRVVTLPRKPRALNPCVPINRAVEAATRPVVLLTNPGTLPVPGLVEALLRRLDDRPRGYVAAACRELDSGRWLAHSTVTGGKDGRGYMPPGASFHHCAVLRRSLFAEARGFDERYRDGQGFDDNDFLMRLNACGATFDTLDEVVVAQRRSSTEWPAGGLERNRRLFETTWAVR